MGDFVSFDLAKKLKEKGYPNNTSHQYNEQGQICVSLVDEDYPYPCPEIHQVLKWLREEMTVVFSIVYSINNWHVWIQRKEDAHIFHQLNKFASYEEAALAGIEYVLDNLI